MYRKSSGLSDHIGYRRRLSHYVDLSLVSGPELSASAGPAARAGGRIAGCIGEATDHAASRWLIDNAGPDAITHVMVALFEQFDCYRLDHTDRSIVEHRAPPRYRPAPLRPDRRRGSPDAHWRPNHHPVREIRDFMNGISCGEKARSTATK